MNESLLYLMKSGICVSLFYLIYRTFLKKETFFSVNRLILIMAIPVSLAIPLIRISSPIAASSLIEGTYISGGSSTAPVSQFGLSEILLSIYLLGVAFFLIRFIYKLFQLFLLIRKSSYHIYDGVKIVVTEEEMSPFSFFNYFFINKADVKNPDFDRIMAHELAHIHQFHSLDLIFLELFTIFQWFNPFVWPYKESLKETHEYLADHAVIAQGCSKTKYQLLIFEQLVGLNLFEFTNNFNQSLIKRRITMMAKIQSKGRAKFKVLLVLPVIALLVLTFAESKTAADHSGKVEVEKAISNEGTNSQTVTVTPDKSDEKKEQEKKMKELEKKMQELEEAFAKTDDPEKKEAIKKELRKIQEIKASHSSTHKMTKDTTYEEKMHKLKVMYKETDDPEKKEKIKMKLEQLKKEKEKEKAVSNGEEYELYDKIKKIEAKQKALKAEHEKTDNPEKKKEIKQKYKQLEILKEKVKTKLSQMKDK